MAFGRSNSLSLNTGAANSLLYVYDIHSACDRRHSNQDATNSHYLHSRRANYCSSPLQRRKYNCDQHLPARIYWLVWCRSSSYFSTTAIRRPIWCFDSNITTTTVWRSLWCYSCCSTCEAHSQSLWKQLSNYLKYTTATATIWSSLWSRNCQ